MYREISFSEALYSRHFNIAAWFPAIGYHGREFRWNISAFILVPSIFGWLVRNNIVDIVHTLQVVRLLDRRGGKEISPAVARGLPMYRLGVCCPGGIPHRFRAPPLSGFVTLSNLPFDGPWEENLENTDIRVYDGLSVSTGLPLA